MSRVLVPADRARSSSSGPAAPLAVPLVVPLVALLPARLAVGLSVSLVTMVFATMALATTLLAAATGSAHAASTSCLPGSLRNTLSQVRARFGPISVLSAHRPGARIAGSGRPSFHASCRAVDFRAPAGRRAAVVTWLRANHSGGLGVYSCGMSHIHIDNGPPVQWSKCVGGRRSARR